MTFPKEPRHLFLPFAAVAMALILMTCAGQIKPRPAYALTNGPTLVAENTGSGIYGFSGSGVHGSPLNAGIIGECIWIYDATNTKQIAAGNCDDKDPGKFRVELPPGRYIVRGPSGNKPVEVKTGSWTQVESIGALGGY
jgi:hypothetical protein